MERGGRAVGRGGRRWKRFAEGGAAQRYLFVADRAAVQGFEAKGGLEGVDGVIVDEVYSRPF
jgi:hypothetical protein